MPRYHIHRMKEAPRRSFRWAPHASGTAAARPKDYELDGETDAVSPYAAWAALRETRRALQVGDILESEGGSLSICKYVGFDEVKWLHPEAKPLPETGQPAGEGNACA